MVKKKEQAHPQAQDEKKQVLLQLQSPGVLSKNKEAEIFCRETFGSRHTLQVLEFEKECNQRCTDEEDESGSDYSEWDTIEQEDTMEEISDDEEPTDVC